MPELPEIEVVKLGLEPLLPGQVILKCGFSGKKLRLPLQPVLFKKWLVGSSIDSVKRRAKYIIITLNNQANIIVHLGMTGKLGLFSRKTKRRTHDHAWFCLKNSMELRFNDVRRFGSLQIVTPTDNFGDLFKNIGPEPFGKDFSAVYLFNKATNRSQPVKNYIMNSHIIAGIGNIYASEILFQAKVRPDKPSKDLTVAQWKKIVITTRSVLKKAIAAGGSTIADFVGSSGNKGYFQLQFKVYGRKNEKCLTCKNEILKTVMAGRATYFCKFCQK